MTAPLPDVEDVVDGLAVVAVPMRVRFRGLVRREAAFVRGPAGWGEFAPFVEYAVPESARWLACALEAAWSGWPDPVRGEVPVNATVPAVGVEEVAGVLARFDGCTTAKVKVAEPGQSLADDVNRVAAVRDVMGPAARIRIDANGAWSVSDAADAIGRLAAYGLEYVEQPCATVPELAALRATLARARIDVPVAADESIRKGQDPLLVARAGAADLVVVKVAPLGGVRRALEIVAGCGLPAVVSSAIDLSVGVAAGVALAAALPDLPYACGLGTVSLLGGDVAAEPLIPVGGVVRVGRVEAEPALLARHAAPPARVAWWRERVVACHAELAATG